jgi:hypothetical protein
MDQVSRTAMEGSFALVGLGQIFVFALAIVILTAVVLSVWAPRRSLRQHPRPMPGGDESSSYSPSPSPSSRPAVSAEVKLAATVGSDYYVPTSDELKGEIKTHILDRQKRDALQLSRELVSEYRRRLESGEAKDIYCVIANPLVDDYTVMRLCEEVLKHRGWSATNHGNGTAFVSPLNSSRNCMFTPIDLHPIAESDSFAELIERNVIAPRKALALRIAKELVDGYRLKLETDKPTSPGIKVTLSERIDYNVLSEVENILAPRGWSVTYCDGSSYNVWPAAKRERPYRGGLAFV